MPKAYWIVHVDVTDAEPFKAYAALTAHAFRKYGARFLARAGQFTVPEGTTRERNTIVEFPSYRPPWIAGTRPSIRPREVID